MAPCAVCSCDVSKDNYPLAGLKVLDFARVLAGPFAGRMLSDLGADVVKVEPPDGDITRLWGAEAATIRGYYHQQNAGKRNICVDLRASGAKEVIFALAREADIVIENYRPDVMGRHGFDYAALAEVNSRLIMLSISGFGHNGPESKRPAYAAVIHAELGLISRQARRGEIPRRDLPLSVADTNAGLHGLVAILSAVVMRERTGQGQHIDMAMIDATLATDAQMQYDLEDSEVTGPIPPEIWETSVGPILISAEFKYIWHLLKNEVGLADPAGPDTPFHEKVQLRRAVANEWLQSFTDRDAMIAAMARLNLAWGDAREAKDVRSQPTVLHRQSVVDIEDRAGGTRPIVQSPYRFSNADSGVRGPAPHRGEHNVAVMSDWCGIDAGRVGELLEEGVLLMDKGMPAEL